MPNGKDSYSGRFDIKFNGEKAFSLFGMEYGRCNAELGSIGEIRNPIKTGEPHTYQVEFSFKCHCDSVIGEFEKAYKKAFSNKSTEADLDLLSEDEFEITMQTCSLSA